MNGYSEASIVCGGNIGDPGFYLYLAKVKQKLQKILKTDREDLLIEKVERWNSVRVTFRLPPTSADILRSLAEQRPEALRNLGIQSVQVDAGRLVSVVTAAAAGTRSGDTALAAGAVAHSSTTGVNWNYSNSDHSNSANAIIGGPSASGGTSGGLLLALVEGSNSSGDELDGGQRQLERKRSVIGQNQQPPQCFMAAKGISQQSTAPPVQQQQQQQNLLGYLLEEPDQPPPYQDYHQQHQMGSVAASVPSNVQQQRWPPQQQHQNPNPNATVLSWNHHAPPTHSSTTASTGQPMVDYYYHQHQHPIQQQSPHPSVAMPHPHHPYTAGTSAMHSRQQHETATTMAYASGTNNINNNPAYHHNVNFGQQQQSQQNPGNVSNSPLLVGLLQQNSPPPPPSSSSSFMQPSTTPVLRNNNNSGNLSGYNNNELNIADSSPPSWPPVQPTQEPAAKKQKRASSTTTTTAKPKKTPNANAKNSGKKAVAKRAGAVITSSDGNPALDASLVASYAFVVDQDPTSQRAASSASFSRDNSINSVIDSVLFNVAMMGAAVGEAGATMTEIGTESKLRQSLESPTVQPKSAMSSAGLMAGPGDETASQCCSSPMSTASLSVSAQHQYQAGATESPTQHLQQRQPPSVLRSVSSSSSSSSPLVASASPTFDSQWHQQHQRIGGATTCAGAPYGAYQNQPNHQFVRHHPYHQETDGGVARIRRPPMLRQGPRLAQASPAMIRFPAPPGPYPSQTTYDLARHDNTSRTDSNAYSVQNAVKARSPAVATVNGDTYSSPTHPTAAAAPRHPLYHGQAIPQQQEQYGAMGSWGGGDNGGNSNIVLAETAPFMISSKATSSTFGVTGGGADHDYLVATPMDSSGGAPSFASFANDQQQPPVANDLYGFVSTASQQHGVYNYNSTATRATTFYNGGGGGGGEEHQMQEALVARLGSAAYQHQHPPPNWDKQQQRVARHRQPWPSQPTYEPHEGVYDDDSIMRDVNNAVGSSPLDGFPPTGQHQSLISTSSTQQLHHNHGVTIQQQQQQPTAIDDPMLSGQVPAR